MFKKIFSPKYLLMLLLIFHCIGNIVWLSLNNSPPTWDEANHTRRSLQFAQFFSNALQGKGDLEVFKEVYSNPYGPFVKILNSLLFLVFGPHIKLAQLTSTLFFLGAIYMVYKLYLELYKNEKMAIVAAFFFSFLQLIFAHSRWLLLDIPLTFFYLLSIYYLLKSQNLQKRKYVVYAGVWVAAVALTKAQGLIYYLIPGIYFILVGLKKPNRKVFINGLLSITVFLLIFSLWFIPNTNFISSYILEGTTIKLNHPDDLSSATTWLFYLKLIINTLLTPWLFLLLIPALYVFLKKENNYKWFLFVNIIGNYLMLTLISNKDIRFLYPVIPFIVIILIKGWFDIYNSNKAYKWPITLGLICLTLIHIALYFALSWGTIFPRNKAWVMVLPGIQDIHFLSTYQYPVPSYNPSEWPYTEIVGDIRAEVPLSEEPTQILMIPNYEHFNNNTFSLFLTKYNLDDTVSLKGGIGKASFDNNEELEAFITDYPYYIYAEDDIGPSFQWDLAAFQQMQTEVNNSISNGESTILKQYVLPSGHTVYFVKNNRYPR